MPTVKINEIKKLNNGVHFELNSMRKFNINRITHFSAFSYLHMQVSTNQTYKKSRVNLGFLFN